MQLRCDQICQYRVLAAVIGQESRDQRRSRDLCCAAGAVIAFHRDAQAQFRQGCAIDTFRAAFAEHALAKGRHDAGIEPAGAGDHDRMGGNGGTDAPGGGGTFRRKPLRTGKPGKAMREAVDLRTVELEGKRKS